jgi:hypothetical protein
MREMNCRNVRREIEKAGPGRLFSSSVNDHMMNCVACETLSREQTKLQQIVSSLGTVEAPGDFDYRLRTRLADEKRAAARPFAPFAIGHLSLGTRYGAVAAMLLLIGSAFVFFKLHSDNPLSANAPGTVASREGTPSRPQNAVQASAPVGTAERDGNQLNVLAAGVKSSDQPPTKRHSGPRQAELASLGNTHRIGTRDLSSTSAPVLKRYDQMVEAYPSSAFPIDAAYQSLKVSVDNARGTSRTISLPTVSFGSQQSLSQSGPPLLASARDSW